MVRAMYIVARVRQVDGTVRFVGMESRHAALAARAAIASDRAMLDGIRPDAIRDMPQGRKPKGWIDL